MHPVQRKSLAAISAAALALGLVGCDSAEDRTTAANESATARTASVAHPGREQARETTREARAGARDASGSAGASMDRAARDTRAMGAAANRSRETGGTVDRVDDASLTTRVNAALAADRELKSIQIDVDASNGVVTLSGPAPTASAKERAAEVAHKVRGVESVNNQLTIKAG